MSRLRGVVDAGALPLFMGAGYGVVGGFVCVADCGLVGKGVEKVRSLILGKAEGDGDAALSGKRYLVESVLSCFSTAIAMCTIS